MPSIQSQMTVQSPSHEVTVPARTQKSSIVRVQNAVSMVRQYLTASRGPQPTFRVLGARQLPRPPSQVEIALDRIRNGSQSRFGESCCAFEDILPSTEPSQTQAEATNGSSYVPPFDLNDVSLEEESNVLLQIEGTTTTCVAVSDQKDTTSSITISAANDTDNNSSQNNNDNNKVEENITLSAVADEANTSPTSKNDDEGENAVTTTTSSRNNKESMTADSSPAQLNTSPAPYYTANIPTPKPCLPPPFCPPAAPKVRRRGKASNSPPLRPADPRVSDVPPQFTKSGFAKVVTNHGGGWWEHPIYAPGVLTYQRSDQGKGAKRRFQLIGSGTPMPGIGEEEEEEEEGENS